MAKLILALALVYTLLDAVKPLQVDDPAYHAFAAHLAEHPLDPYGFEVFWYQHPLPANEVLAPPVLPYWWSLGVRLFGERPFLWKLWLLPFSLLFVAALADLFRRFTPGLERPLLVLTVLSPAFLPALNLMLDVPALALALFGLTVFLRACDRASWPGAVLAGLLAGLAMQTKYTGLLAPAAMLLAAVVLGRPGLGVTSAAVAGLLFAAWELLLLRLYGESHFLHHLGDQAAAEPNRLSHVLSLVAPLLVDLGGAAPAITLLALLGLGLRRWVVPAAGLTAAAYLLVALAPASAVPSGSRLNPAVSNATLDHFTFGALGLLQAALLAAVVARLVRGDRARGGGTFLKRVRWKLAEVFREFREGRRVDGFLALWLLLELAGYFAMTPFPAVRRLLGVVVVATLLAGRLLDRAGAAGPDRRWLHGVVAANVLLGLGFYGVSLLDAFAEKDAAEAAAALVRPEGGTGWYVGHWGFQFYAERAGLRPVDPDRSRLRRGDWLVVPGPRVVQQDIVPDDRCLEPAWTVTAADPVPWTMIWCYYGGSLPLKHLAGPRGSVTIYRVTADFIPGTPP